MTQVFIVNLDKATQRLTTISERLAALNITWERIPAINGETISPAIHRQENKRARDRRLSFMELGCLHSHKSIWERIVSEKLPAALVLEDDVLIADDLPALINDLSWLPSDDCIIRLETFLRGAVLGGSTQQIGTRSLHPLRSIQHGGAAYIVTNKRAQQLLEAYADHVDTADHMLFRYPQEHNVYQMVPAVCVQQDIYYNGRLGATSALEEQRYLFQLRSLYDPITLTKHFIWRIGSMLSITLDRLRGHAWQVIPFKE